MSNLLKSKFLTGFVIVAALALGVVAVAPASASADCTITMTLQQGSVGAEVMCLQTLVGATADGKFGPMTKASVMAWQAGHALVADGVVGPLTRAALMGATVSTGCTAGQLFNPMTGASCTTTTTSTVPGCLPGYAFSPTTGQSCTGTTTTTTTTTTTDLSGGAGSADYTLMSSLTNEEVGEDEEDVEVAGLEVEANGSDLNLTAVRLVFDEGTAGSDFEEYAAEVSVWLDGEKVGSEDGTEFNDDNNWSSTITLDGETVIEEDETGELVVRVSGVSNLDTNDAGDTWTVDFRSVRYEDAQGASTSEDPGTAVRTFSLESFATASSSELVIGESSANDDVNDGRMLNVHATSVTNDEEIFEFTLEAKGDSDLEIDTFGVNLDTTGDGADHVDDFISGGTAPAIFLELDGQQYGTATYFDEADGVDVGADEDVVFSDVDYVLEAGDKITGRIIIDILAVNSDLVEGDTIQVTLGETETDQATLVKIKDESNTSLADADITGSAQSDVHEARDIGFVFSLTSTSASVTTPADGTNPDIGTFKQEFTVTAFDGDVALDKTCEEDGDQAADGEGVSTIVTNTANNDFACSLGTTDAINSTVSGNSWLIPSGQTRHFTITSAVTSLTNAFAKTYIESLGWDVDANAADTLLYLTSGLGENNTSTTELYLTNAD